MPGTRSRMRRRSGWTNLAWDSGSGFASRRPWRQSASISGFRAASVRLGSAGTFQSARCSESWLHGRFLTYFLAHKAVGRLQRTTVRTEVVRSKGADCGIDTVEPLVNESNRRFRIVYTRQRTVPLLRTAALV